MYNIWSNMRGEWHVFDLPSDPESRQYAALGYIAFLRKHQVSFFLEWL